MNYITKYYSMCFEDGVKFLTKNGWDQMDNKRYFKRDQDEEACFNYVTKIWTVIEMTKVLPGEEFNMNNYNASASKLKKNMQRALDIIKTNIIQIEIELKLNNTDIDVIDLNARFLNSSANYIKYNAEKLHKCVKEN